MPSVARLRATPTQPSRDRGSEFQHPAPHRFVGDVETSLGQQFLDVAVAQGKAQIEPDRVLDDLGGEAMPPVAEQGHANILPDPPISPGPVSVTMPPTPVADTNGSARGAFRFQRRLPGRAARVHPSLEGAAL